MKLELTAREVEIIRQALRAQEALHKRNNFEVLVIECQELRSYISDVILENESKSNTLV